MNPKDKRNAIRIPLLSDSAYIGDTLYTLKDITEFGAFFEVKELDFPKPHSTVRVGFQLPGDLGMVYTDAEVTRLSWAKTKKNKTEKGFAVKFLNVPLNIQKILGAYVTYLRNKQIITVSKRIIEEFFNGSPKTY